MSAPATMRAVRLRAPGGPEQLVLDEVPVPAPGPGEVLVRVRTAAITRDELEWPVDRLPAIPSYELAGTVTAAGPGVDGAKVGDEVVALTGFDRDGAAAELAVVPADRVAPRPAGIDDAQAAALPLAGLTAWQGLVDHGGLQAGGRVLVLGALGGVGHLAVQLARSRGAHVVAPVPADRAGEARALGVDDVVDPDGFPDGLAPVDLVFDTAGGARLARAPAVLRPGGRLVSVAEEPPSAAGAAYFVVEPSREGLLELGRLVEHGELRPRVGEVFALEDARRAFERSLSRDAHGKIVLRVA